MPRLAPVGVAYLSVLCLLLPALLSHSFVLVAPATTINNSLHTTKRVMSPSPALEATVSTASSIADTVGAPSGDASAMKLPDTVGISQLSIRNEEEGYDLNGWLNVKHEHSKSVWVLCHGLCSSCQGTVPLFVSEKLDANSFR